MSLSDLPKEIIEIIENFVEDSSIYSFLSVNKYMRLQKKTTSIVFRIALRNLNEHIPKQMKKCIICNHDCLTQIHWQDGNKRCWIPWCIIHTDALILKNIDIYCMGYSNQYNVF